MTEASSIQSLIQKNSEGGPLKVEDFMQVLKETLEPAMAGDIDSFNQLFFSLENLMPIELIKGNLQHLGPLLRRLAIYLEMFHSGYESKERDRLKLRDYIIDTVETVQFLLQQKMKGADVLDETREVLDIFSKRQKRMENLRKRFEPKNFVEEMKELLHGKKIGLIHSLPLQCTLIKKQLMFFDANIVDDINPKWDKTHLLFMADSFDLLILDCDEKNTKDNISDFLSKSFRIMIDVGIKPPPTVILTGCEVTDSFKNKAFSIGIKGVVENFKDQKLLLAQIRKAITGRLG